MQIVIIGAGISGLATGYYLKQKYPQADIEILEKCSRAGGVARGLALDGFLIEQGPTLVPCFGKGHAVLELIAELGLEKKIIAHFKQQNIYFYKNKALRHLPLNIAGLLGSGLTPGLLRALLKDLLSEPVLQWDVIEESVASYCIRHFGSQLTTALIEPLIRCLWAGDMQKLSLPALFPILADFDNTYGSVIKGWLAYQAPVYGNVSALPKTLLGQRFVRLAGGMQTLTDRLTKILESHIRFEAEVRDIVPHASGFRIYLADGVYRDADIVVSTLPAHTLSHCLYQVNPDLIETLKSVTYAPLAIASLTYDQPIPGPDGIGHMVADGDRQAVLGAYWVHKFAPDCVPDGKSLFNVILGGAQHSLFNSFDEHHLIRLAESHLKEVFGIRAKPSIEICKLIPHAIPQFNLGTLKGELRLQALAPNNLYITGSFRTGHGLGDMVYNAKHLAVNLALKSLAPDSGIEDRKISLA